jgi:putative Mn2+ efflux pump MntP
LMAKLIALVRPLGLETFVVAAAVGISGVSARQRVRVTLLFIVFEGAMPPVGLALGAPLGRAIGSGAGYTAIAVLIGFGLYTLAGTEADEAAGYASLLERGPLAAFVFGLSVRIDELAIGFTLGLLGVDVVWMVIVVAAHALVLAQLGLRLGGRLSERTREAAERLAGLGLLVEKLLS